MDVRYVIAGFVVGCFIGFSGVGGGSPMTPLALMRARRHLDVRALDSLMRQAIGVAINAL